VDEATYKDMTERTTRASELRRRIGVLTEEARKLQGIIDKGMAIDISLYVPGSQSALVKIEANASRKDTLTPIDVKSALDFLHATLVVKLGELKEEYTRL